MRLRGETIAQSVKRPKRIRGYFQRYSSINPRLTYLLTYLLTKVTAKSSGVVG